MKAYAHKIGAVFFVLWGILHIVGGVALLQQLSAEGTMGVLATLGSAVPMAKLPAGSGGVTGGVTGDVIGEVVAAVLAFFAFNWVWIGLLVLVVGIRLNWHNNCIGYWLNLYVAAAADVGLIIFLLAPGYMAVSDGWPGPLLWLLAAVFSTIGVFNHTPQQAGQATPA
jgi:hypothetical protein